MLLRLKPSAPSFLMKIRNKSGLYSALFLLLCLIIMPSSKTIAQNNRKNEIVILLHGIGNTKWNMYFAETALKQEGYATYNLSYPSLEYDIPKLSAFIEEKLESVGLWRDYAKVHFVTHSMGGLIARTYLNDNKDNIPKTRMGRVVMIAPPNQGSEVSDFLQDFFLYQWSYGPAGQQLTTAYQQQQDIDLYYDLGIIAGRKEWPYPVARLLIPEESDGRVAVSRTKLKGMKDHITIPATHTFISWKASTHQHIIDFLKNGRF